MKLILFFPLCLLMCYIHVGSSITSESSTTKSPINKSTKEKDRTSIKSDGSNTAKTKDKSKAPAKNTPGSGTATKDKSKASAKTATGSGTATKDKSKASAKSATGSGTAAKDKAKPPKKDTGSRAAPNKEKRTANIRTPFDKVLDKLSNCASSSPSIVEVMQENLQELQSDEKYTQLFQAAPHTAAFLNKKKQDSNKFIDGLRQALNADWSNPTWTSWNEIDTLFRPFKQQFVYAMMRFNCT